MGAAPKGARLDRGLVPLRVPLMPLLRPRLLLLWLALASGLLVLGAKLMLVNSLGSDLPYMDEWDAVGRVLLLKKAHGDLPPSAFLEPQNEHRVALSRAISLGLIDLNGQWDGLLEMTVNAALHAAFCAALLLFLRRFLKGMRFTAAALLTTLLFVLAFDWENTLQGFQSQFYLLEWAAFATCLLCVPGRPLSGRWWLGWAVGLVGLGTMSSGFFGPAAALAVLLLRAVLERRAGPGELAAGLLLAVLCAAGLSLLVTVPGHEALKAHTLGQWLSAAAVALSWPETSLPLACVVLQLPFLLLLIRQVRERRVEGDVAVLLALGIWCGMQVAALAYGRANRAMMQSPRYSDIFAVGSIVNAVSLGILWPTGRGGRGWGLLAFLWASVLLCGLWTQQQDAYRLYLADFGKEKPLEQRHVRQFLLSGDRSALHRAPAVELPYPKADALAGLLSEPAIRSVLPVSVRPCLALSPAAGSHGFVASVDPSTGERIWSAERGPARLVSEAFPVRTLGFVRVLVSGSPDLDAGCVRIEPQDEGSEPARRPLNPSRWNYLDLQVPSGSGAHLVAEIPAGEHRIAFTEPVEIGGLSRADHWLLRRSSLLASVGGILFGMAMTALFLRDGPIRRP